MKHHTKKRSEAEKALERINRLAEAFKESSPEKQQAALDSLSSEIDAVRGKTVKNWMIYFRNTLRFLQSGDQRKLKAVRAFELKKIGGAR